MFPIVARQHIRQPLGALLHARQCTALRSLIRRSAPGQMLENALGPARLTVDVAAELPSGGTILDASAQMFEQARSRLTRARYGASWHFVHGDAFRLCFGTAFDFIHSFRLIRHFEAADRGRIYAEAARVLRSGGLLVFRAAMEVVDRLGGGEPLDWVVVCRRT